LRGYVVGRILQGIFVVWILTSATFLMLRLLPADPTAMFIDDGMPPEAKHAVMVSLGLDKPLFQQYVIYLVNMVTGQLGESFFFHMPVSGIIRDALLNSLMLIVPAILVGATLGVLIGAYLGSVRRGSWIERIGVTIATILRGSPAFVLGVLALMIFSYWLGLFPASGIRSPGYREAGLAARYFSTDFLDHAFLPMLVLTIGYIPETLLIMRTGMFETRGEDYLDLVRAKGVSRWRVTFHAARNSLLPVLTWVVNSFGFSIAGVVVVETVFNWPGIGRELALSVTRLDFPVAQATFLFIAFLVVALNLVTDLLYAYLDPRIVYN
jgi:peptide/nickel transport system permease protein